MTEFADEAVFFEHLRREAAAAYAESPLRRSQGDACAHYEICATPLRRGEGIVCGFAAASVAGETYAPQTAAPERPTVDAGYARSLDPLLQRFLGVALREVNVTNLCFFRTATPEALEDDDWRCAIPLFLKYTLYLDPPWIVFTDTALLDRLVDSGLVDDYHTHVARGEEQPLARSYSGHLRTGEPFACVPAPGADLAPEQRAELWQAACHTMADL